MTSRTIIKSSGYNFARHKSGSFDINFSEKYSPIHVPATKNKAASNQIRPINPLGAHVDCQSDNTQ